MTPFAWLIAAPLVTYGGELEVALQGGPVDPRCALETTTDVAAQTLVFEPLFTASGAPVIGRAVEREDGGVRILLAPPRVAHSGRKLRAEDVVQSLQWAAHEGCLDLAPLLDGPPEQAIFVDADRASVFIRLRVVPEDVRAHLSMVPMFDATRAGTGPFAPNPKTSAWDAFVEHPDGRPYLDRVRTAAQGLRLRPDPSGAWQREVFIQTQDLTAARTFAAVLAPHELGALFSPNAESLRVAPGGPPPEPSGALTLAMAPEQPQRLYAQVQLLMARAGWAVTLVEDEPADARLRSWVHPVHTPARLRRTRVLMTTGALRLEVVGRLMGLSTDRKEHDEALLRSGLVPLARYRTGLDGGVPLFALPERTP